MTKEQLRALAEAAREDCEPDEENWYLLDDLKAGFVVKPPDFEYVAAVSPNQTLALLDENERLRTAAQAVVDRWDTPSWKDVPATAIYINKLRMEILK